VGIAAICERGTCIVLATDRSVSVPYDTAMWAFSMTFDHPSFQRAHVLAPNCGLLMSGPTERCQELMEAIRPLVNGPPRSVAEITKAVQREYRDARIRRIQKDVLLNKILNLNEFYHAHKKRRKDSVLAEQKEIFDYSYGIRLLLGTIAQGVAHLSLIANPGAAYSLNATGFWAIGEGFEHALNSMITSGLGPHSGLREALTIVLQAKMTAEKAQGASRETDVKILGPHRPVDIARSDLEALLEYCEERLSKRPNWRDDSTVQEILQAEAARAGIG
jgi:hypothetical protein